MNEQDRHVRDMAGLLDIMRRLRDPAGGCPWDRQQSMVSLIPYTLEEAYEVAGAIGRGNPAELCEELGDLLFQVVFYAQIAEEQGDFVFADIVQSIAQKLIRRHPHVFGDENIEDAEQQTHAWERLKEQERRDKGSPASVQPHSELAGVCEALPALMRAQKIQRRAARVGFDWDRLEDVVGKIEEELQECLAEVGDETRQRQLEEEIGDLLFSCVNFARHVGVDAENALRGATDKFAARFRLLEQRVAEQGKVLGGMSLQELDHLWEQVKSGG